jgi:membrane-bound lytic murein transglycosylase A
MGHPGTAPSSSISRTPYTLNTALPEGWNPVDWKDLPGWEDDAIEEAWNAFLRSCTVLQKQDLWKSVCQESRGLSPHPAIIRRFIEERFTPYAYRTPLTPDHRLITGYYQPLFQGSRQKTPRFRYPLYAPPDDLVRLKPLAKSSNSRARRDESGQMVPYWTREEIEAGRATALSGKEIVYLDNPIDVLVAQIQGSVRIRLDDRQDVYLGYADANGHPYKSVGRFLIDQGYLPANQVSMPSIHKWLDKNPDKFSLIASANPSYVFFKEINSEPNTGPIGTLGVPLTPMRSVAVDPHYVPLGTLVYITSNAPDKRMLQRLAVAQDTGSAILGAQRADFFWGMGEEAGQQAGRLKSPLNLWVLWPKT